MSEAIGRGLIYEDSFGLRELLKSKIQEIGWHKTRSEIDQAISSSFEGYESKHWYKIQYLLLETFELSHLAGYDGLASDLFEGISDIKSYSDVKNKIESSLVSKLEKQLQSGSSLFLSTKKMVDTSSAVLIPTITEKRKKEVENFVITESKGNFDLTNLWMTSYGHLILLALGLGLTTDKNGFKILSSEISKVGGKLEKKGQPTLVKGIRPRMEEMVHSIASISDKEKKMDVREFRTLIQAGYPLPSWLILQAIGNITEYQFQGSQMIPGMEMPEEFINPDTLMTYADLFASSPSVLDALGRAKDDQSYFALKDYLRITFSGPLVRGFHYEVMKQLHRYNESDIVDKISQLFREIRIIKTKQLIEKDFATEEPSTLKLGIDILRKYNYPDIVKDISQLLGALNSPHEGVYPLGLAVAESLMEIGGKEALANLLTVVDWVAPSQTAFQFVQETPIRDMLVNNADSILPGILEIVSEGPEHFTVKALDLLGDLGDSGIDVLLDSPELIANAIALNLNPLSIVRLVSNSEEIVGLLQVKQAIESRVVDIVNDLKSVSQPSDIVWQFTNSQTLIGIKQIRAALDDIKESGNIEGETLKRLEAAMNGSRFTKIRDPATPELIDEAIKELDSTSDPRTVLRKFKSGDLETHASFVEVLTKVIQRTDRPELVLAAIRGSSSLTKKPVIAAIASSLESHQKPWELLAELSSTTEIISNEKIREAALNRIDIIAGEIKQISKMSWIIESICAYDYLITDSRIVDAVAEGIETSETPWWIIRSINNDSFLKSERIRKAIHKQTDNIISAVQSSKEPYNELKAILQMPFITDDVYVKAIAKAITNAADPVFPIAIVSGNPKIIANKVIVNAALSKVSTIAQMVGTPNMSAGVLSAIRQIPKLVADPQVVSSIVHTLRTSDSYPHLLSVISDIESFEKNEDIAKSVAMRISQPVDIVIVAEAIGSSELLQNPNICSKVVQVIRTAQAKEAVYYQSLGRVSADYPIFEKMGDLLKNTDIQNAIQVYIPKNNDKYHIEKIVKTLEQSPYPIDKLIEAYKRALSGEHPDTFIEALKESVVLAKEKEIHSAIAGCIKTTSKTETTISAAKLVPDAWNAKIVQDAVVGAVESSADPSALVDKAGLDSLKESDAVKVKVDEQIENLAKDLEKTSDPLVTLKTIGETKQNLAHPRIKQAIVTRLSDIAKQIEKSTENMQYTVRDISDILEYEDIRKAMIINFENHGVSFYFFGPFAKYTDIVESEGVAKGAAKDVLKCWDIDKTVKDIEPHPAILNSSFVQDALTERRKQETSEHWTEKGRGIFAEEEDNKVYRSVLAFEKATKLDPKNRDAHFWLAKALHKRRSRPVQTYPGNITVNASDIPNAENAYRRCIEIDSKDEEAWRGLIQLFKDTGRPALASQALSDAKKHVKGI